MLIGEVATATSVSTKTLRFYEHEQLLHEPERTPGGYRDYADDVIDRVHFIRRAQAAGLTLRQIRQILAIRDGGQIPCEHVAQLVHDRLEEVEERLRELRETRRQLRDLRSRLAVLDPVDCDATTICSAVMP